MRRIPALKIRILLFAHSGGVQRFPVEDGNVEHAHWQVGKVAEVDYVAPFDKILRDGLQKTALHIVHEQVAIEISASIERSTGRLPGWAGKRFFISARCSDSADHKTDRVWAE